MKWELVEADGLYDLLADDPAPISNRRPPLQCLCGRFAKWGGDRHYYNGWFDCYSYDVICSRCGVVTVECV